MKHRVVALAIPGALVVLLASAIRMPAQPQRDALEQGFQNPPDSAKPRTWWHWTNSNVSKDGITKDLEWMQRVGIGGFQLADVAAGSGQTVEEKIVFGTPEWMDAVRHSAAETERLGLEMSIFSSAGWSETGGPWVKPEQAMKKVVWSETTVMGPQRFSGKLPQPPTNNGPIRNMAGGSPQDPTYYGDSAVVAYPTPPDEVSMASLRPTVTLSSGASNGVTALMDDDLNSTVTIPAPTEGPAWVQYEFAEPFSARAITLAARGGIPAGRVTASEDGKAFRTLVELPGPQLYRGGMVRTFAFPETQARFYRIEMTGAAWTPAAVMAETPMPPASEYVLGEAILHAGARVHRAEEKAGFSFLFTYESSPTPAVPTASAIPVADLVDLTDRMAPDGTLNWEVPEGRWTILRVGYSLTGSKNRPAVAGGLGYEVDKLSREHVESYYHGYFDPISNALGPLFGQGLDHVLIDSWEAGMQNWTQEMIPEFRQRRGYDPTPYLPVLAGRVVESAEVSDRFLWDFRRTLADMFADNHFGVLDELLAQQGIETYGEAAGVSLEIPEDTLLNKSKLDIPMGEFWVRDLHPFLMYYADVRGAASAGHVYGKNVVAAESFTGGGYESPATLKNIGDYWFAQGINRIVFHTSAHQPLDTKPGNTMVGTHINRNITWAEQAEPFMTYLARNSFMLQQGRFVADLVYLLDEGAPSTMPFWGPGLKPAPPEGYDYDYINTDVLLNRMSVGSDGRVTLPNGMSYAVLVLPEIDEMTLPVLRKLRGLVAGGATIVGRRPKRSPSLAGFPEADGELQQLADELWGDLDGISRTLHPYGEGVVVWGRPLDGVLEAGDVLKDFEYAGGLDVEVPWIHRRAGEADIYFVVNRTDRAQEIEARFRVDGKEAELWRPDDGSIEATSFSMADGRTIVPLHLEPRESVFVVLRRPTQMRSRTVAEPTSTVLATIPGAWEVSFPPDLGAPPTIELPTLMPWTANANEGVKYFSGTATYTKDLEISPDWLGTSAKLVLDLGDVKDIAEVSVNGQELGTLWKPPYKVDVTKALKSGINQLELRITNEWTNRLIGDRLASEDQRVLGAVPGRRGGNVPDPPESGLIGPVRLYRMEASTAR